MNAQDSPITIGKLKGKDAIDQLFKHGKKINSGLVLFRHLIIEQPTFSLNIGVSAPKKILPKAVDRNKVKRLLREAVRLNEQKFNFLQSKNISLNGIFLYHGTLPVDFELICLNVNKIVTQLTETLEIDK